MGRLKDRDFWDDDTILKDLLFETNLPLKDIAAELDITYLELQKRIKKLGLEWVRRSNRKLSRGHAALTEIIKRLVPGDEVINEYHIGERLMLDVYCPKYKIAAEYHGRQHFFYSNLFHKDKADFEAGQKRDERKAELCKELGIALVVFRFTDKLTEEAVFDRIMDALRDTPRVEEAKVSRYQGNEYYEQMKRRNREYRKARYRELKNKRDDIRKPRN